MERDETSPEESVSTCDIVFLVHTAHIEINETSLESLSTCDIMFFVHPAHMETKNSPLKTPLVPSINPGDRMFEWKRNINPGIFLS